MPKTPFKRYKDGEESEERYKRSVGHGKGMKFRKANVAALHPDAVATRFEDFLKNKYPLISKRKHILSPASIYRYKRHVKTLVSVYHVQKPSDEEALRVMNEARARCCNDTTLYHYVEVMGKWALMENVPFTMKPPQQSRKRKPYLKKMDISKLLDDADTRVAAILAVGIIGCLRPKEICELRMEDLDWNERKIWVKDHGKGIKDRDERFAIITSEMERMLQPWLEDRLWLLREKRKNSDHVFITMNCTPFTPDYLYHYMRRHGDRTEVPNMGGRILRLSGITNMAINHVHIKVAQTIAGHTDPRVTLKYYTEVDDEFIYKDMQNHTIF